MSAMAQYIIQLWNFVNVVIYFRLKSSHGITCSRN